MEKLNAKLEILYLYADGTPVPKASFVLETAVDSTVMAGPLDYGGRCILTVPRGFNYRCYVHHDLAPDGSPFQFAPEYKVDPGPFTPPGDWNRELTDNGKAQKIRLHWGTKPDFDLVDPARPRVEQLLLHVVSKAAPGSTQTALHLEAAQILMAMLLGKQDDAVLWRRLIVNRCAFSIKERSRLCQELLCLPGGLSSYDLACHLNSTGKGNAVDFLRLLAGQMPGMGDLASAYIAKLIAAAKDALEQIKASVNAGAHNQKLAEDLLTALAQIPAPATFVDPFFGGAAQTFAQLVQSHPAMRDRKLAPVDDTTTFRQVARPFPAYVPGPVKMPVTWFEASYLYADKNPIVKAKLVVQNAATHAAVKQAPVDEDGIAYVEVPLGVEYEFRFDADEPEWKAEDPAREAAIDPADAADWVKNLIAYGSLETGKQYLKWGDSSGIAAFEAFRDAPSLSQILRLALIVKGLPRRKNDAAAEDKAGEAACTALLRALLYAEKASQETRDGWWREASFHRLRSVLDGPDGALAERLLALLHDKDDHTSAHVFEWLNSCGKGNAKAWLKQFKGKLADYRAKAAAGLQDALDCFATELKKIAEPDVSVKDKLSAPNILAAKRVLDRLNKLPKAQTALEKAWEKTETNLEKVLETKSDAALPKAALETMNEVVQKSTPVPARPGPELPDPGWIELLYLYADGSPVKGAKYKLPNGATDVLDEFGLAFEVVPKNMTGDYEFTEDPNVFELLPASKIKPKDLDVGAGMIDLAVNEGKFKQSAALVRWGAVHYTDNDAFKNAPSLSQILSAVVKNQSPHVPTETCHEEITLFLYPLIMADLLSDQDQKAVWKHASFHRLGCCLGEPGAVIRDLLYWLSETADPKVADAIERLNSVGRGNAYKHLGKLHGEIDQHIKAVADNITAILDGFKVKLDELIVKGDPDVAPAAKRFLKDAVKRIDKVKGDVAAKVGEALTTAKQRLDTVRQQAEPAAKAEASVLCLNIHQQKKATLDPRPAATPPEVDWLELEYQHHDGIFVEEAEYVITSEDGANVLMTGKLDEGFAHLVAPKSLKFKYYFRRDKAFALDVLKKSKAIATFKPYLANLAKNAVLLKKLKKTNLEWGAPTLDDAKSFRAAPSVGAIATNIVREPAVSPHLFAEADAEEMAKLLHPLLLREAANSADPGNHTGNDELWLHAVLNRLSAVLGEDGHCVTSFLWTLHSNTKYQGGGILIDAALSIKKPAALEFLNALGRGNAIRWLETLDPLKDANKVLVKGSLDAIFTILEAEMDALRLRPVHGVTPIERKMQSTLTENYALVIKNRIGAVKPAAAGRVDAVFAKLKAQWEAVKNQPHEKQLGALNQLNLVKQKQNALPARVAVIPPWIELQYLYEDGEPVPNGQYELLEGVNVKRSAALGVATGFVYVTDVPACDTYFFKKENNTFTPRADSTLPLRKRPEGRKQHTIPDPGYRSYNRPAPNLPNANWSVNSNGIGGPGTPAAKVYNQMYGRFYAMGGGVFGWIDDTEGRAMPALTGVQSFQAFPSIRMLAAKAVHRNTSRCCHYKTLHPSANVWSLAPDPDPERIEMVSFLEPMVYNGAAVFGGGAPNVLTDLAVWSAAALNRVGTTNHGACIDFESRLRKAVLLDVHCNAATITDLIERLNSAGKGHAVRWLRKLYADRTDIKTGVVNSIRAIVTEIRADCDQGILFTHPPMAPDDTLGAAVVPKLTTTRTNCDNLLAATNIRDKIDAVLDPVFAELLALLPSPLNPRPYAQPAALSARHVFVEPTKEFPLAEPQPTPPLWDLGTAPTTIELKYENSAGGNVTADYHVTHANVPNLNGVTGVQNFVIPAAAAVDGVFYFKNDVGALTFKDECKPFTNPEQPCALLANFLDTAVVHNPGGGAPSCFFNRNNLAWEGTEVVSQNVFQANPTIGQIFAKCVIDGMPRVSSAGDVQDLTVALMRLVKIPAVRADLDEWFRAAVVFAGSQANDGSVIKGILLRVRKHGDIDPEEYFKLINFASNNHGNAIDWLKTEILNKADIGGAAAGLKGILTAISAQLNKFAGYGDPPVNAALKNFIAAIRAEVINAYGAVDAKVPAAFAAKAVNALTAMRAKLPIKRPACVGRNLYKREVAEMFLESQQTLNPGEKQTVDEEVKKRIDAANDKTHGTFAALSGGALGAPYNKIFNNAKGQVPQTLHAYLDGTRGMEAKSLAPKLAAMNNAEFVEHVESLSSPPWTITVSKWGQGGGMGTMTSYEHPDGTLIRYKPHGDEYQRPPAPMYSIEVMAAGTSDAMFKIDPNGNAVPWGPGDAVTTGPPALNAQQVQRYKDDVSKAGHRPLRY